MFLVPKSNELVGFRVIPVPGLISAWEGDLVGNELVGGFELENGFVFDCGVSLATEVVGRPPAIVSLL